MSKIVKIVHYIPLNYVIDFTLFVFNMGKYYTSLIGWVTWFVCWLWTLRLIWEIRQHCIGHTKTLQSTISVCFFMHYLAGRLMVMILHTRDFIFICHYQVVLLPEICDTVIKDEGNKLVNARQ